MKPGPTGVRVATRDISPLTSLSEERCAALGSLPWTPRGEAICADSAVTRTVSGGRCWRQRFRLVVLEFENSKVIA